MSMRVEVAYATQAEQVIVEVEVPAQASVDDAIRASGLLQRFADIDLARAAVGIFGERVTLAAVLHDGDRVEIYRPLVADPKEARRRRARKRR
jgi:putative ubiquitin-RnfH superfamily antitoxin RatB of RatAB toxin-antitoxin module